MTDPLDETANQLVHYRVDDHVACPVTFAVVASL